MKKWRVLMAVPLVGLAMTAGTATAASAATGTPSGAPPSGVTCVSVTGAKACYQSGSDKVWVKDTKANGQSAAGTIKSLPSHTKWYRECFNTRGAAGGWVVCDFDVPNYQPGVLWAVNNPFIGAQASTSINTGPII
ncbi:hypothetical protein GCM10009630_59670 [Kribbella jejuensis]|uniref:Peptidase inhibitor family I36 n=1 Tax=Kribbella jejuensis TaxID=236068 RepID=A0A542ETP2_9ACTN|nr:hypothetical protein [Kribbella jejuensis]TQJ18680.1 hypothetical protein FB475_2828 [Kribbella jejuensis]